MKIIIAGSRSFNDYERLSKICDFMFQNLTEIEIISGRAKGADLLGEKYAKEKGYPIKQFPANWNKFGKSAGYKRNVEMANYADAAIIFWNGKSNGSKHMIDISKERNLKLKVVIF